MTTTEATTIRYLAKCPACKTPHAVDVEPRMASSFLTLAFNEMTHRCRNCNRALRVWKAVNGHYSDARVCDGRCLGATGPNCDCQCGGENHGRNHL